MSNLSGNQGKHSNSGGGLAGQLISGLTSSGGHGSSSSHGNSGGLGGQLVGQLASNLFSSGSSDKPPAPQNYHGGQSSQSAHHSGGIAGAVMGGVANMFGGSSHHPVCFGMGTLLQC
jgi:hypothetical protein